MISEEKLKNVVAAVLAIPAESITAESSKDNIPSWDSLKQMNLILALEEEFGVTIPDLDAMNLTSYPLIKLVMQELVDQ